MPELEKIALSMAPTADAELSAAFSRVLTSRQFILGAEVSAFEAELGHYLGSAHAIGVSSGTDALIAALLALDIGPGDEVVTTPFTFIATAEAIARVGARPVFADVDPVTLNLDPARVVRTPSTRAVLPVHLFGHPAELIGLELPIIEDAAQAIGARAAGRRVGTLGRLGCFSFFPTKPLGALGDGGAVVTADGVLAERIRRLRQHGSADKHLYVELGGNFRLDALQAAFLRVKLPRLEAWLEARRAVALAYSRELAGIDELGLPATRQGTAPAWAHYVVRVRDGRRDALAQHLDALGIATAVYYPRPLHLQPVFAQLGYARGDFPQAERAADEVLALPLFPGLTAEQQGRVVEAVRGFFR